MKNKALISFCINILVGILFCFPVFTAESAASFSHSREIYVSCNELCINNTKDSKDKLKKEFPKTINDQRNEFAKKSFIYSGHLPIVQSSPVKYYHHFYFDLASPFKKYLEPVFIDLSYLKELEITKVLC